MENPVLKTPYGNIRRTWHLRRFHKFLIKFNNGHLWENINTGSRLQRVRLLWAPGCNEQLFYLRKKADWHQLSFSLNSLKSMNNDKVQKWDGCQWCSMSGNRYIPRWSRKNEILITTSGWVSILFSVAHGIRYLPRGSTENVLSITIVGNVSGSR